MGNSDLTKAVNRPHPAGLRCRGGSCPKRCLSVASSRASGVPADLAGVGGGVLTTTQQTSLALGVAMFGSLFASLSLPGSVGYEGAFVLIIGLLAGLALLISALARKLPDPR